MFPYKLSRGNLFNLPNQTKRPLLAEQVIKGQRGKRGLRQHHQRMGSLVTKQEVLRPTFKSNLLNHSEGREIKRVLKVN